MTNGRWKPMSSAPKDREIMIAVRFGKDGARTVTKGKWCPDGHARSQLSYWDTDLGEHMGLAWSRDSSRYLGWAEWPEPPDGPVAEPVTERHSSDAATVKRELRELTTRIDDLELVPLGFDVTVTERELTLRFEFERSKG